MVTGNSIFALFRLLPSGHPPTLGDSPLAPMTTQEESMSSSKQTFHASSIPLPITPKSSELASTSVVTSLASDRDVRSEGNISGNEELRINGAVGAPISLKCLRLTIGQAGRVTAEVIARQVIVYGQLFGNLRADDRIEIKKD